jgi:dTDP-4-dehydrorhamnose reductase
LDGPTLIFGAGWLGTQWAERLGAALTTTDIADADAVRACLEAEEPAQVINAAGATGSPNVDALESQPARTYRSNVVGPLVLAAACRERDLPLTHLGSGCIYSGDNAGAGFAEEDTPNFSGSLYARTKAICERALRDFDVLQLRIRLPIASRPGSRNLLTKLLAFERVISVPNSVTILDDFWEPAEALIRQRATGVWNMVNDGVERHDELLTLWQSEADPTHTFGVIPLAELEATLTAGRSNCVLSTAKLQAAGLALPNVTEALPRLVRTYAEHLRSNAQTGA